MPASDDGWVDDVDDEGRPCRTLRYATGQVEQRSWAHGVAPRDGRYVRSEDYLPDGTVVQRDYWPAADGTLTEIYSDGEMVDAVHH